MFYPGLSVCLFVCLFATLRENYCSNLHEHFARDVDTGTGQFPLTFGSHWNLDPVLEFFVGFLGRGLPSPSTLRLILVEK